MAAVCLTSRAHGLTARELSDLGVDVLAASAYGVLVRPGPERVAAEGGLGRFIGWAGPVLTDSGGVVPTESWGRPGTPAPRVVRENDDGLTVTSYLDGSSLTVTPESSIAIQAALGSDIMTALGPTHRKRRDSQRGRAWAQRALAAHAAGARTSALLVPITDRTDLDSVRDLAFDGAVLSVQALDAHLVSDLPTGWITAILDCRDLDDVKRAVRSGADLIGCPGLLEAAARGRAWTTDGEIDLTDPLFARDLAPLAPECGCPTCSTGGYARATLHHLFAAAELLGPTLLTMHNLATLVGLVGGGAPRALTPPSPRRGRGGGSIPPTRT